MKQGGREKIRITHVTCIFKKKIFLWKHHRYNNLRIHKHSIRPASSFQKWNQILRNNNFFKIKIAKICVLS